MVFNDVDPALDIDPDPALDMDPDPALDTDFGSGPDLQSKKYQIFKTSFP